MKARISKIEYHLPQKAEDADELLHDNPDWDMTRILEKTGIPTRFISLPNETAVDLALEAGRKLTETTPQSREAELLILVTQSPDYVLPTSACTLQHKLGLTQRCLSFDVNLGCSGFVGALSIAGGLIHSGAIRTSIVLCAETYSKYIDRHDRTCRPLFSDAAAAIFVEASEAECIGPFNFGTDGSGSAHLIVRGSGAKAAFEGLAGCRQPLEMRGSDVFLFTMRVVPSSVEAVLAEAGLTHSDIDLFVFHQASKLVVDNLVRSMSLPEKKVFTNYDRVGNTVSASIPIALKDAQQQGRLQKGDRVLVAGFGVGLSWGAALVRWDTT